MTSGSKFLNLTEALSMNNQLEDGYLKTTTKYKLPHRNRQKKSQGDSEKKTNHKNSLFL